MLKEFRDFAVKGNALDLAIGVVLGAAFGAIVASFVNDLINPIVGLLLGKTDLANLYVVLAQGKTPGPYASMAAARDAGAAVFAYGAFLNAIVNFLIIAVVLFFIVKAINRLRRTEEAGPTHKDCPYCLTSVPVAAVRCPACTSDLSGAAGTAG